MAKIDVETTLAYKDTNRACNQGSIIHLHDGELLLGFNQERGRFHADSGQSCVIRSSDHGRSWAMDGMKVVYPFSPHEGNWDCALASLSDGTVIMHTRLCSFMAPTALRRHDEQAMYGVASGGSERLKRQTGYAVFKSSNRGDTWQGPIPVNTFPVADAGGSAYMCGGSGAGHIIELADGGLLMPLMGSTDSTGFTGRALASGESTRCFMLRSDDRGENWEYWSTMAYDPANIISYQEPSVAQLADGSLVCLMRATVRPTRFDNMWFTRSLDGGITWEPPRRTNIWGYPPDVLQLQDGRVLAVYGYRRRPMGVRGCISPDGVAWDVANEFVIRDCVAGPASDPVYWHIGYPSVAQTSDGTVVVAYHEYSEDEEPVQYMLTSRFRLD